jgi:hypothetical protein
MDLYIQICKLIGYILPLMVYIFISKSDSILRLAHSTNRVVFDFVNLKLVIYSILYFFMTHLFKMP